MISTFKKIGILFRNLFFYIIGFKNLISDKASRKPLLMKVFYTLLLLAIFRIGTTIVTPGIQNDLTLTDVPLFEMMNLIGGGALSNFSIFALGISPFITANIIMTLLQTEAFPPIYRMSKAGPQGRRKINIISRVLTIFFAFLQAATLVLQQQDSMTVPNEFLYRWVAIPMILIAGSLFTIFLSEQITNKGVGNGTSLIIFSGIVASLPNKFQSAWGELAPNITSPFVGIMNSILYTLVYLSFLWMIAFFYKSERHIPIQQTGSGLTNDTKQMSRLPIKLNPAGVMPVIFALTMSTLPLTVAQFLHHQSSVKIWIETNLILTSPVGLSFFVTTIFIFTLVMALVTFNPTTVSDNFKKNGTFIPGIRPGADTEKYLTKVVLRLAVFSAFYLAFVSGAEYLMQAEWFGIGLSQQSAFGGTTLIILVTVSLETIEQLYARDKTQKISTARKASVSYVEKHTTIIGSNGETIASDEEIDEDIDEEGLLW